MEHLVGGRRRIGNTAKERSLFQAAFSSLNVLAVERAYVRASAVLVCLCVRRCCCECVCLLGVGRLSSNSEGMASFIITFTRLLTRVWLKQLTWCSQHLLRGLADNGNGKRHL